MERNYLEVYVYDKWSDKEIPDYSNVTEFQPTSIDLIDGSTEPPRLLTEADLIALMDKHGTIVLADISLLYRCALQVLELTPLTLNTLRQSRAGSTSSPRTETSWSRGGWPWLWWKVKK